MVKKKLLSVALVAVTVCSMIFTGCGSSAENTGNDTGKTDSDAQAGNTAGDVADVADDVEKPEKITIMVDGTFQATLADGQEEWVNKWEELTGIELEVIQPDHNAYYDVLGQTFASGPENWPDVVILGSSYYSGYAGEGALWDMTDAWNNSELKKNPNTDVISDILSSYFIHSYIMQGSRNSVYTILLYDREELDKVEDLFSHVHTTLLQEYNIWIYGGLGCTTDTISSVWKSYRQSKEAVKRISSPVYLCLYREILEFQDSFFYPNEVADQLYNFVKSGNFKQTKTIFNFIKDENFKKRKLNSRQVKWLLENIEITLLKVIRDNDISYDDSSLAGLSEDSTLKNYEQIALELCEKNKQPENDNQLIVRIQAYIDENYGDPSLCLSRISDLFHISESYFSFLFKKTVGVNFSTYLEQVRMTQAKHLLETTNIKITDLYVAVGYNNLTSFRRAFKKKYGVAPNALRE